MTENDLSAVEHDGNDHDEEARFAWRATIAFLGICLAGGLLFLVPPVQATVVTAFQALADSMTAVSIICR